MTVDTDRLRGLLAKATPGRWAYREHSLHDWGTVSVEWTNGWPFIICQARDPRCIDEADLGECRRNNTDPWEANATLIAELRNAAPALLDALKAAEAARVAAEAERDELRVEVARLTEALRRIAVCDEKMIWGENHEVREALDDALSIARAALEAKP